MVIMNQISLCFDPLHRKTRKEVFLGEMNQVVPRATLVALIELLARGVYEAQVGRSPFQPQPQPQHFLRR